MVIYRMRNRILGLGNAADAIEILSIGYILAVYEDHEGLLSRLQQSTYSNVTATTQSFTCVLTLRF